SSSSGIVQLKQPRPFSKIEMARRNQAGHRPTTAGSQTVTHMKVSVSNLPLSKTNSRLTCPISLSRKGVNTLTKT
ncbi:hypothetical protein, partial [Burkholderia pseudomallei]|uniref:hypothetical protein n=1 Tax=Burkholderia pseudomallei TaxID=28450 RepID=UPI001C7E78D7